MIADRAKLKSLLDQGSVVPCGTCTRCCEHEQIPLTAEDDPSLYDTEQIGGVTYIARREDGGPACRYLKPGVGCSIHGIRPKACRMFDCRAAFLASTRAERKAIVRQKPYWKPIFDAARERADTLEQP